MVPARHGFSEVSIEFAHVGYAERERRGEEPDFSTAAMRHVDQAIAWFGRDEASGADARVSKSILVDDYFGDPHVRQRQAEAVLDACAERGVVVDHVVYESSCVATAKLVVDRIADDPRPGDGAATAPIVPETAASRDPAWLSSNGRRRLAPGQALPQRGSSGSLLSRVGGAPRSDDAVEDIQPEPHRGTKAIRGYHDINVEVQLYDGDVMNGAGTGKWSCPLLAAAWQLLRLGVLQDEDGNPLSPEFARLDHPSLNRDPEPFAARATLSLLTPAMLQVEYAVRLILGRLELPGEWVRQLRQSHEDEQRRPADLVLERIAYGFVPIDYPREAASATAQLGRGLLRSASPV
jgi:hypothetical protein